MADMENKNIETANSAKKPVKKSKKPSAWSRMGTFFRSLKGEFKKISWFGADDLRKNTIVVLVLFVVCTIALGVMDTAFTWAIKLLDNIH